LDICLNIAQFGGTAPTRRLGRGSVWQAKALNGKNRLMNLLTALDQDVEIVIRRKPRSRKAARISVVAA
jgi:hypothetical protein